MNAAVRIRAVIVEGDLDAATIATIRAAMDSPETSVVFATPRIAEVVDRVAWETGVAGAVILGTSTARSAIRARFAVYWIAHAFCGRSYNRIGQTLGGRDHQTVRNGVLQAQLMRQRDPAFLALTDKVIAHFRMGGIA